jgi:DNA-binding response OmpR family regulator
LSENKIVLLVEDDKRILDINRRVLEQEGFLVLTAETLAEAREHLAAITPNVIVLDIILPDGNGLNFLPELRKLCVTPVLFLTGIMLESDTVAGLRAGGDDYMLKPHNLNEFCLRVKRFLNLDYDKGNVA